MMKTALYTILLSCFLLLLKKLCYGNVIYEHSKTVIVQLRNCDKADCNLLSVGSQSAFYVLVPKYTYAKGTIANTADVQWKITDTSCILLDLSSILGNDYKWVLAEPGDSIIITKENDGTIQFSGNAKSKLEFIKSYISATQIIITPKKSEFDKFDSINDFWELDTYCDKLVGALNAVCNKNCTKLSDFAFNYLKGNFLADIEYKRLVGFENISLQKDRPNISNDSLSNIFKRKIKSSNFDYLKQCSGPIRNHVYYYGLVRLQVFINHGYRRDDPVISSVKRKIEYYQLAKLNYVGTPLQSCLTLLLTHSGLKDHTLPVGYSPEMDSLLGDFYSIPGYENHKEYVKNYELNILSRVAGKGLATYDFKLKNVYGQDVRRSNFKGKIVLLNFWNPRSGTSTEMNRILHTCFRSFEKDTNIVLINISYRKNRPAPLEYKLIKSPADFGQYNLFMDDEKESLAVIKGYNITQYPRLFLLDENGTSVFDQFEPNVETSNNPNTFPDPRKDNGVALIETIKEKTMFLNDGPYVLTSGDTLVYADYMRSMNKFQRIKANRKKADFLVSTDEYGGSFKINLADSISVPKGIYERPEKVFIISDIEGNFKALRKLLVSNHVMNQNFEWTFGSNDLVIDGDMFDRGKQVTECLWLLYSLEQKAKKSGGCVHFIIGNHEVMNLIGDLRYADNKYQRYMDSSGRSSSEIWGNKSELGRWIRSKNIIEKIGDVIYVHAGISPEVNSFNLSIDSMNNLARNYLQDSTKANRQTSKAMLSLFDRKASPFWYRGYYQNNTDSTAYLNIEKTLVRLGATRIVTGHTITADTVNVHFSGKVINVDTRHASGKSEGLLIDNDRYYRVDLSGTRRELFFSQGQTDRMQVD